MKQVILDLDEKKQNKNGTLPTMIKCKYDKGNSVIYKT